ncbi:phosphatase PAP2 family protein [Flavobacterium sp.]|uniref:phosphatase PAP2 family protein n=1 Tax=Flavobacterium sp. TaxID=239 RepID=UPI003D0E8FE4
MKNFFLIQIICLGLFCHLSRGQQQDSISVARSSDKLTLKKMIIPTTCIAAGLVLRNPAWRADLLQLKDNTFGADFHTRIDDYLQFVPISETLLGNSLGFQSKHGYAQMVTNELVSNLMIGGIVYGLKNTIKDVRPDGSAANSFPSGHTATAFNNAMIHYLEYKDSNKWFASSGFVFAVATGVLRVANTRHWPGDVAAGAGIGMATALVVHYWSPLQWDAKKQHKRISSITYPIINDKIYGIGWVGKFK